MQMLKYTKHIFLFFKSIMSSSCKHSSCNILSSKCKFVQKTVFVIIRLFNFFIGCPFVCSVSDTSRVSVSLSSLELVPVNQVARFHMAVDSSGSAELAVAVTGPSCELPVKVCTQLITYIVF